MLTLTFSSITPSHLLPRCGQSWTWVLWRLVHPIWLLIAQARNRPQAVRRGSGSTASIWMISSEHRRCSIKKLPAFPFFRTADTTASTLLLWSSIQTTKLFLLSMLKLTRHFIQLDWYGQRLMLRRVCRRKHEVLQIKRSTFNYPAPWFELSLGFAMLSKTSPFHQAILNQLDFCVIRHLVMLLLLIINL